MNAKPDLEKYEKRLSSEGARQARNISLAASEAMPLEADNRHVITYDETRHDLAVRDAARALVQAECPLYLRGPKLMWLRDAQARDCAGRPITIRRFTDDGIKENLRDELNALTNWRRARSSTKIPVPIRICTALVEIGWKLSIFPEVEGLFMAPTLRPDGSLLGAEGYDPATRLLLVGLPAMPAMSEAPSPAEARAAFELLSGLLSEVQFVGPADRSVALSLILSGVIRGAMAHIPLHIIKAPTIGSGKSFLVDVANMIATGQRCAAVAAKPEKEKWEKQIALALHGGDPIVSLDNFNGELSSDLLAQAITQPAVKTLLPYGRDLVEVECRSVLTANGNNITIADDLGRRVVLCQIDAATEKPWERHFAGDPLEEISRDRGKYVAAALTIVLGYVAAGQPLRDKLQPLNGFADYTHMVREPLVWLAEADPAATQDVARSQDMSLQRKAAVFSAMAENYGVGESNAKSVAEMLVEPADEARRADWRRLQEALAAALAPKPVNASSVGYLFRTAAENVLAGLRLTSRVNRMGSKVWWVDATAGGYGSP